MPWQNPPDQATKRRGRKTKEEEARDYLAQIGMDPMLIDGLKDREVVVPPPQQLLEEFVSELYKQMKLGELGSTALVQGLKAVADIAKAAQEDEPEQEGPQQTVAEILADAGLPVERRVEIGRGEIGRLRAALAALEQTVAQIEGGQP